MATKKTKEPRVLTQAEHMAALRAKRREAGFTEIVVWAHRDDRASIKKRAKALIKARAGAEAVFPVEDY